MKNSKKIIALILVFLLQLSIPAGIAVRNSRQKKLEDAALQTIDVKIRVTEWSLSDDVLAIHTDLDTSALIEYPFVIPEADEDGFLTCKNTQKEKPPGGVYINRSADSSFYIAKEDLNFRTDPNIIKEIGKAGKFQATPYISATVSYGTITFNKLCYNGKILAQMK